MDSISKSELQQLLAQRGGAHVSIYMPAVVAGPQTEQNPIRFKNLLRAASDGLGASGYDKRTIDELLSPAQRLLDDHGFWEHQDDGLALFINAEEWRYYRLPVVFDELAETGERFHLKPLLSLFSGDGRFYILTLSLHRVRLVAASQHAVREIALGNEVPDASSVQHAQHAQGGEDDTKLELRKFFNRLDQAVRPYLRVPHAPLVLAGVDYLLPLYRMETHYHPVLDDGLTGNWDDTSAQSLQEKAWPLVEVRLSQGRRETEERYFELSDTERAANSLETVVPGAVEGRVASLFVARGVHVWGALDLERRTVELHDSRSPDSVDLLETAAVYTYALGGDVYVSEPGVVPDGGSLAAILRY